MGKIFGKIAIGLGFAAAGLVTGGAAWLAGAGALGAIGLGTSVGLIGAQYLMRPSSAANPFGGASVPTASGSAAASKPPLPLKKTIKQSDVPRNFIFGRTRTSGSYFFYETDTVLVAPVPPSTPGTTTALNLYQGIYICDGPIDGFDGVMCDDEAFSVGSTGNGRLADSLDGNDNVFIPTNGTKYIRSNFSTVTTTTTWQEWVYGPVCVHYTWVNWVGWVCDNYQNQWHWETRSSSTTSLVQLNIKDSSCVAFEPVIGTEDGYNSFILNNLMTSYSATATSGLWDINHLGKGITCLYTYANAYAFGNNSNRLKYFPNAFPEWSVFVRGARVYDPRDPYQDYVDPRSGVWSIYNPNWHWSENPALCAAHFVSWLIENNLTSITGVDWDAISEAANDCDALTLTTKNYFGNGTSYERFARITGVYYFDTPPREFLANIMAACDGTYGIDKEGRFTMWIGKWEDPSVIFDETDISSFTEEFVEAASEAVNELHVSYTEPRQGYSKYEAPVYVDVESEKLVGKRISSLSLDMVPSGNQAYRLGQRHARRINGKKKITVTLGPRGMLAIKQRVVGLNSATFGLSGTWRVESLQPDGTLRQWSATLREITKDVFNDEPPSADPLTKLKIVALTSISAPVYFSVHPYSAGGGQGYAIISGDVNVYDASKETNFIFEQSLLQEQTLDFDAQYSIDYGLTWSPVNISISKNTLQTPMLPSGSNLQVQTRYVALNGQTSAWSATTTIFLP